MADAVTTQIIQDGPRNAVIKFTNISDGTGESAVDKVIVKLNENDLGDMDFRDYSGIPNNAGVNKTGNISFTTTGHSNGDTYTIILTLLKA